MIRLLIQYAFLICALLNISFSNAQNTFNKVIHTDNAVEAGYGVVLVSDGYIFQANGNYQNFNGWRAINIIKTDFFGNEIEKKQYGKNSQSWYNTSSGSVINSYNKSFTFAGGIYDSITDQRDGLLIKFDENGDTLFSKKYGGNRNDIFLSIRQIEDGSFYLLGSALSYDDIINGDFFLVKTDSAGNELWYRTYGTNNGEDRGASIDITADNNLILSGGTNKFSPKPYAPWLIKTDTSGNIIWDKHFGTLNGTDCGGRTIALINGDYLITGCIDTLGLPLPGGYVDQIVRADSTGNILWRRVLTHTPEKIIRRAKELQDGTLLFAGEIWNTAEGRYTGYLIKYDANGNLLWERTPSYIHIGRPTQGACCINDFAVDNNDNIICTGYAFGSSNNSATWLLKLDEYGCEITGCHVGINEQEVNNTSILAFPNPAQEHTTVAVKLHSTNAHKTINITCYDTQGKTIYTTTAKLNASGYTEQQINTATWGSGIYYYTVNEGNEEVGSGKIIVQ